MKKNYKLTSLVLMLFVIFNTTNAQTTTYYVSTSGNDANNGTSWATAFRNLTTALWAGAAIASPPSVIINVAAGTYKPDEGTPFGTGRDATFKFYRAEYLSSSSGKSLKLYGGFDAATGKREIGSNNTILSGDIGVEGDNSDNVFHIAAIVDLMSDADSIVVDGFTIRDGNANGSGPYAINPNVNVYRYQGGGVYLTHNSQNDKVAFRHCIFTSNAGSDGGGLYYDASIVSMDACVFFNNSASGTGGGAIRSNFEGKSVVINSIFFNNSGQFGSAILDGATSSSITNSTFTDNVGNNGCITAFGSTILVANNIIYGNQSGLYDLQGTINAAYNIIQGGFAGTGNINADPLFAGAADKDGADNTWGTADDGLRPNVCSPAVNAGSNDADKVLTLWDITGAARIQNSKVDMGAYELSQSPQSVTYYWDQDKDGYGDAANTANGTECSVPSGYVKNSNDCNDNDANINPNTVWVLDSDNDGYYTGDPVTQCASPETGYVIKTTQQPGDCNDNNAAIHPGVAEICGNGTDDNCDGQIDEGCTVFTFYEDADNDGYGNPLSSKTNTTGIAPAGYVTDNTDCDDTKSSVNPGAVEICSNGIDDNCDGQVDEGCSGGECANATSLNTNHITEHSARLNWTASINPAKWEIQYKKASRNAKWVTIKLAGSNRSLSISSLAANQKYTWQIKAKCGTQWTTFSNVVSFRTHSDQFVSSTTTQQSIQLKNVTEEKSPAIKLYPNPTRGRFVVELHLADNIHANGKIELVNIVGQTVSAENANISNGVLQKTVSVSSSLTPGIYIVKVVVDNKTYVSKLVYEK